MKKTSKKTKAPRNVPPALGKVLDGKSILNKWKYESIGRIAVLLQEFNTSFVSGLYIDLKEIADEGGKPEWYVLDREKAERQHWHVMCRTRP
ncbi:MAG: hypothetical protein AMXMBFR13_49310 [Phycisphaerae bacterium]